MFLLPGGEDEAEKHQALFAHNPCTQTTMWGLAEGGERGGQGEVGKGRKVGAVTA